MKLFLTSSGLKNKKVKQNFVKFIDKSFNHLKVIMFSIVANKEEQYYVDESIQELLELGLKKENLMDFNLANDRSCPDLTEFDLVYICGGNTYNYLDRLRKLGCFNKIKEFVLKGGMYFGVSAGSILVGPDINIASPWDENNIGLKDLSSFNFIDFTVSPHYQADEKNIIKKFKKVNNIKVYALTDDQALFVDGHQIKLLGDGTKIIF